MKKRWDILADIIKKHGLLKGAEVGVKSGRNLDEVLSRCPKFKWIAVDPWCPTENYKRWSAHMIVRHEAQFNRVLDKWKGQIVKIKDFSVNAAKQVSDNSLDLVFIDGDHSYEGVIADIDAWLPKIRKGGFISGHDFDNTVKYGDLFKGVDKAVEERFAGRYKLFPDHVWMVRL